MGSGGDRTWILPGFRVVRAESDSLAETARLMIRIERRGIRQYRCGGCGRRTGRARSIRDRTWDGDPAVPPADRLGLPVDADEPRGGPAWCKLGQSATRRAGVSGRLGPQPVTPTPVPHRARRDPTRQRTAILDRAVGHRAGRGNRHFVQRGAGMLQPVELVEERHRRAGAPCWPRSDRVDACRPYRLDPLALGRVEVVLEQRLRGRLTPILAQPCS